MRKLVLILTIFLLLGGCSGENDGLKLFSNDEYSFQLSNGWKRDSMLVNPHCFFKRKENDKQQNLVVMVREGYKMNLSDFMEERKKRGQKTFSNYKINREEIIKDYKLDYGVLDYDGIETNNTNFSARMYIIKKDNVFYTMTFSCDNDSFKNYLEELGDIFNTFSIYNRTVRDVP